MNEPIEVKIAEVLKIIPTTQDQLDPREDQYEAAEEIIIQLIKSLGFDHFQAARIARTCHWYGWNQGYRAGWDSGRNSNS